MHMHIYGMIWPLLWIGFFVWRGQLRHRRRMEELRYGNEAARPVRPAVDPQELADLRSRVKVLERITVDERSSRQLADEIESLRDR